MKKLMLSAMMAIAMMCVSTTVGAQDHKCDKNKKECCEKKQEGKYDKKGDACCSKKGEGQCKNASCGQDCKKCTECKPTCCENNCKDCTHKGQCKKNCKK